MPIGNITFIAKFKTINYIYNTTNKKTLIIRPDL